MSIRAIGVTKLYGTQKALDDVTFDIPSGQVVGFLGPNGAGKSTMMKIITGYIPQTSGLVEVDGINVENPAQEFRAKIGYLPENNPLYHEMYVKEYLSFVASVYKIKSNRKKRIDQTIEMTGIGDEQNKKIGALSKGYRQRVGLAQALIHNPLVLILDEPTSGLDPNQIIEIRNLIKAVGKEKTVMLSTHIMQEVEAICQRIIIINKGRLIADGSTIDIVHNSMNDRNCYLVEFINQIPDNLLKEVEGVLDVTKVEEKSWLVYSEKDRDIRENLFLFAANNGFIIITLQKKEKQLEEIFQSLTSSN